MNPFPLNTRIAGAYIAVMEDVFKTQMRVIEEAGHKEIQTNMIAKNKEMQEKGGSLVSQVMVA